MNRNVLFAVTLGFLSTACGGSQSSGEGASDPCRVMDVEDDGFSVSRSAGVEVGIDGVLGLFDVNLIEDERGVLMVASVELPGVQDLDVPPGTPFDVRLESGDVVTLASANTAPPQADVDYTGVFTRWDLEIPLSREQLAHLGSSAWVAFRMSVGSGTPNTAELGRRDSSNMQSAARCLTDSASASPSESETPQSW